MKSRWQSKYTVFFKKKDRRGRWVNINESEILDDDDDDNIDII